MPELPEVETTRRGIAPHVLGRAVRAVTVRESRLRWPVAEELQTLLPGSRFSETRRRGKYLLLKTELGWLMIHLGMSGSLRLVSGDEPVKKHDHVDIELDNGMILRYHDPRRFGALLWVREPDSHALLCELGPEPLEPGFDGAYLHGRAQGKSLAIKSFIMDSHVVVGVGNIYANEALFRAGIHPDRAAGRVAKARYEKLAEAIRAVLTEAIRIGGTTLRDFVGGDGAPGYFQQKLNVYGRGGQTCRVCGELLKESRHNNRATVFCPRCQT
ncbi:MAG: bifunctional DNA-formamidopyrimidine glycosylase/DNA-(apurinic or apyrimidinic site) lyase [Gammaproteobacteria bacterium]|nr:bifunctional DNA-formamidopyrimidine glycosylase/DNA-(apurinic or apyrimidinic site) lyase [Gammaproteobacteria bacterium]